MSRTSTPSLERPYRSLAVRIFNGVGSLLRSCGCRRTLSADRVLRQACRQTGHRDFGELDIREPLSRLLDALEQENHLTAVGRRLIHLRCLQLAKARLGVQAALQQHPEILGECITRPMFILGLPRTGSTLMQRLLAQDPGSRALYLWELIQPSPWPGVDKDRRIRRLQRDHLFFSRYLGPQLAAIHPSGAEVPEECRHLLMNTFGHPAFREFGRIDRYLDWLDELGRGYKVRVYQEYRKQLQLLQWKAPRQRWVLKAPLHAYSLDVVLELFPDACVIQTHRDLAEVVPSACSLFLNSRRVYAEDINPLQVGREVAQSLVHLHLRPAARVRASHPERVFDISYQSLMRDPVGTVRSIYERFELSFSAAAERRMRDWLASNPQGKHGRHRYSLEQFGLDRATLHRLYPDYPECFGVPAEALQA